jgi:hypothetical protein
MNKVLKNYLLIVLLLLVSLTIVTNWYFTGDPGKFFFLAHKLEIANDDILEVDVEFSNRKVYLNVHLKNPSSCKKVVKDLGISNILIGERTYIPTCTVVGKNYIRIVYTESLGT